MANFQETPCYGTRFVDALAYAANIHSYQIRKQGNVPYLSHLLQVAGMVMEAGGDEDAVIAALLHDALEDLNISVEGFGIEVPWIIGRLSENKNLPKADRKRAYCNSVKSCLGGDERVILISCADKLHNLRSYATDARSLWKEDTAIFYSQLMPIYEACKHIPRHWVEEMWRLLAGLGI